MATSVAITDEAEQALDDFISDHELEPTKKAVVSAAILRYVEGS